MWHLIKAELSYNRLYLTMSYLGTLGLWFLYLFDPSGMVQLFGVPTLFLMLTLFTRGVKEKRERLHAILPVAIKRRGFAGWLLYAPLFYLVILSGWTMQWLRERAALANEYIPFAGALTLIGLTLGIVALAGIHADLKYHSQSKYRRLTGLLLWSVVPLYLAFKLTRLQNQQAYEFVRDLLFYTPVVAVMANIAGAALVYLSVVIYNERNSYLA